jgi:S-layer protein (TIGR01567 family)
MAVEIRGHVATDSATWTADDFPGFYYDIDDNIKTEELITTIDRGNKLSEWGGVTYTTTAMADDFEFEDWGFYDAIGFLGQKYFVGYLNTVNSTDDILFEESDDKDVLYNEQLLKILIDSSNKTIIKPDEPLKLAEGYELAVKAVDTGGILLELTKNGKIVDSDILSLTNTTSTMADATYYYKSNLGETNDIVLIAAHFKNLVTIDKKPVALLDGLWQLSDIPVDVSVDAEYDKMSVQTLTANSITMVNEDNEITLTRNREISLMPGIGIKTADSDDLRYYIFLEDTCECG